MKRRHFIRNSAFGVMAPTTLVPETSLASHYVNEEILVYVFLRGGIDGLNVVVPLGDKDHEYYSIMRPKLGVPDSGTGSALPIESEPFGFNPIASPIKDLYDAGHLAIVHATGTPDEIASRSHFDAEKYIELGTPGNASTLTGWLHRHFLSMTEKLHLYPDELLLPIIANVGIKPKSLLGNTSALTAWSPQALQINNAFWRWSYTQLEMLPEIYNLSTDPVTFAGHQALIAEQIIRESYNPQYGTSGTIPYQSVDIAKQLSDIAQFIKLEKGTRIFVTDYGNWDTHGDQDISHSFDEPLDFLCRALAAFFDDLNKSGGTYADRTTVIVQSEFGRRAYQNNSNGTDHGSGNIMLVLGKQVNGGKFYGEWPGLYPGTADEWVSYPNPKNGSTESELFEGSLATTTDFRQVLSEYLFKRCQYNSNSLEFVFPDYSGYKSMGIFKTLIDDSDVIFKGGFET